MCASPPIWSPPIQVFVFMVWVLMLAVAAFLFGFFSPVAMFAAGCGVGQIVGIVIYRIEFGHDG